MVIGTCVCIVTNLSGGCCFPRVKSGQYGAEDVLWSVEVASLELLVVPAVCLLGHTQSAGKCQCRSPGPELTSHYFCGLNSHNLFRNSE